jgi:hypothetical protein
VVRFRVNPPPELRVAASSGYGEVVALSSCALAGVMVWSSSSGGTEFEPTFGDRSKSSRSVSVSAEVILPAVEGNPEVDGGYKGELGMTLVSNGSTSAFHGPWNGLPSTSNVSIEDKRQSQPGSECILFLRTLRVCSLSREVSASGRVWIPVASAMRTRREVRLARNEGSTRRGLEAMLSSSRLWHMESAGERAPRKFAETSNARRVSQICGSIFARNEGTAFGVDEDAINRCVVPGRGAEW